MKNTVRFWWLWFVVRFGKPIWVVGTDERAEFHNVGELGLRVFGVNFWYYKWPTPMLNMSGHWRVMEKREFGEVIRVTKRTTTGHPG